MGLRPTLLPRGVLYVARLAYGVLQETGQPLRVRNARSSNYGSGL